VSVHSDLPAFDFPAFQRHPLIRSPHAQTILGVYWPTGHFPYVARTHILQLGDGDRLVLHDDCPGGVATPDAPLRGYAAVERRMTAAPKEQPSHGTGKNSWQPGDPVVLLLHGLGGSHRSTYCVRTARYLNEIGVRVFRLDHRGCGAGYALAIQPGHAGRSADIAAAIHGIRKMCPGSPIITVGYSLSGNMLLKMAGEMGDDFPADLDSIVAVAPPIDLARCCQTLIRGWGKIYDRSFVGGLTKQLASRHRTIPRAYAPLDPPAKTLIDFDDRYTARVSGFESGADYYARSSAMHFVNSIRLPTWVISASDDPLIPPDVIAGAPWPDQVRVTITGGGGHLGFIGRGGIDPTRRWLDWRVVDWVRARMAKRNALESTQQA
jgi:predicted alpha/beta-fold hydrolase